MTSLVPLMYVQVRLGRAGYWKICPLKNSLSLTEILPENDEVGNFETARHHQPGFLLA